MHIGLLAGIMQISMTAGTAVVALYNTCFRTACTNGTVSRSDRA